MACVFCACCNFSIYDVFYRPRRFVWLACRRRKQKRHAGICRLWHRRNHRRFGCACYQFYYLAKDNPNKDFRKNVFDILCAHLRHTTSQDSYREEVGKNAKKETKEGEEFIKKIKPTEEVQSLLDVLFRSEDKSIFTGIQGNLKAVYLAGADLTDAYIKNMDFSYAKLNNANFGFSQLHNIKFIKSELNHVAFMMAKLEKTLFNAAKLDDATYGGSHLNDVNFSRTTLNRARFRLVNLKRVDFYNADMRSVLFGEPYEIHDVKLDKVDFHRIKVDKDSVLPQNIIFIDENHKRYKTDKNGKPGAVPEGE